ncbi:MAG: DUF1349 domain-containing protein [Bryobacteraceae bacterium]
MRHLDQRFDSAALDPELQWMNAPKRWWVEPTRSVLIVEPDSPTDFWQRTHYGFEVDNGHFLYAPVAGDFAMTTHLRFHPAHQYDQAGLMVRMDQNCWLKTSVEYEGDDPQKLGAVVTNGGYSDWSVQDFDRNGQEIWLRVSREGDDLTVQYSTDGSVWTMLRIAHLHGIGPELKCGLYACSPKGEGFRAEFSFLRIDPS